MIKSTQIDADRKRDGSGKKLLTNSLMVAG